MQIKNHRICDTEKLPALNSQQRGGEEGKGLLRPNGPTHNPKAHF